MKGISLIPAPGATTPQYADLALDTITWDIALPVRWLYGADAIVQRITVRLRFWRGDWYLDQRLGVPYRERIFGRGRQLGDVNALFSKVIRTTPGVKTVKFFRSDLDRLTRTLTCSFNAELVGGTLLVAKEAAFIL